MQELVAGVERLRFDLETDVEQQRGAQLLPFSGMSSKSGDGVLGQPWGGGRAAGGVRGAPAGAPCSAAPTAVPGSPSGGPKHCSPGDASGPALRGSWGALLPPITRGSRCWGLRVRLSLPCFPRRAGGAVCELFTRGLCTRGERREGLGMGPVPICKILGTLGRLCPPLLCHLPRSLLHGPIPTRRAVRGTKAELCSEPTTKTLRSSAASPAAPRGGLGRVWVPGAWDRPVGDPPSVSGGRRHAVPVPARGRGAGGGVQALAARAVQEGRRLRLPARLRRDQDARVLLPLQVR